MRLTRSLSGTWEFIIDPQGSLSPKTIQPDRQITVPLPWQAAFPELEHYAGYAWYRRRVDLEEQWLGGTLLMRFGAVDYWCRVFVNGQRAGEHEGGYTPFDLQIEKYARPGANEITVQVYDPAQNGIDIPRWPNASRKEAQEAPPFDAQDIPHGKQEWYINVGGIWQDVQLIAAPRTYINHVHVQTDIELGQASFTVELSGEELSDSSSDSSTLRIEISGPAGEVVGGTEIRLTGGESVYQAEVKVEGHTLWSMENPYLYTVKATLQTPSGEDELSTRFGFREISTRNGQILLNGEPIFLLCALDQDLYPDTIYTVPSEEFLRDEFEKAKHLGLNMLRCHIKPPDPRYLDLADEIGLLVWAEIPSWRTFYTRPTLTPEALPVNDAIKRRVEQTLVEIVRRDFNHPSLVIWTIVNEDWGTSLPLSAEDRAWVAQMYERCKELDPTRLVVDNSACPHPWGPNIHVHSDLDDFHIYASIPDNARSFERTMEQFGLRPMWTYSSHGDAERTGREPLVLSEFGNWGLPSLRSLREHYGSDPGWFKIGAWWSPWEGEPGWPQGVEERFNALGLEKIWGNYESFATATQWHQYHAMKFEIEAMRRQPTLAGYVITELSDAYWESNGLLDFARNPKAYHDEFASINAPDVILPRVGAYTWWDDRAVPVEIHVAHYGEDDWADSRLLWSVEGTDISGEIRLPAMKRGEVLRAKTVQLRLPGVDETRSVSVNFTLQGGGGRLAQNTIELLVMPSKLRKGSYSGPVAVVTPSIMSTEEEGGESSPPGAVSGSEETPLDTEPAHDGQQTIPHTLAAVIGNTGYRVTRQLSGDVRLAISNYPTADLLQWVREGGDLVFICEGPSPFFWAQHRHGAYSGGWITSFSWLRDEVHRRLKVKNPLGLPFTNIMPRTTILGLPFDDPTFQQDFLSGMISGWVHQPAVHTVQFRYGKGRVVMTTFALEEALYSGDAAATAMLHDLVEHVCSDACKPTLTANY